MAVIDLLHVLQRRWYVLVGVLLASAVGAVGLAQDGGVYSTRVIVEFTYPGQGTVGVYNGNKSVSIITFAQTVAAIVNDGKTDTQYFSVMDAPLWGSGLREGYFVAVRNDGTQWASNLSTATIEIQIVGRTEQWVQDLQDHLLAEVKGTAQSEQAAAGVPKEDRIALHVEPLTTVIEHIVASRSSQLMGTVALFAAAMVTGAAGAWLLDRMMTRSDKSSSVVSRESAVVA